MTKEELKPIDVSKYTVTESGNVIKDNLKQEAEEYANNLAFVFETDIVQKIVRERVRLALIDVLEPREKRIAELEALIEKMKCCENCQHHYFNNYDVISCAEEKDVTNKKCKFWELSIERR